MKTRTRPRVDDDDDDDADGEPPSYIYGGESQSSRNNPSYIFGRVRALCPTGNTSSGADATLQQRPAAPFVGGGAALFPRVLGRANPISGTFSVPSGISSSPHIPPILRRRHTSRRGRRRRRGSRGGGQQLPPPAPLPPPPHGPGHRAVRCGARTRRLRVRVRIRRRCKSRLGTRKWCPQRG